MQNARFQIYTGEGKGKTTCALGLTLRGLGYGWKVYFGQFLKDTETGESRLLSAMEGVTFQQFGSGRSLLPGVRAEDVDRECALRGLECIKHALTSGEYDLVVADEIGVAVVPYEDLEKVYVAAREQADKEIEQRKRILEGAKAEDLLAEFGRI